MLFKNIGIVDENFDYVKSMFVETKDDRIVYVSSVRPENYEGEEYDGTGKVLMPGFVEGHAHSGAGSVWDGAYLGWFDQTDPDGKVWPGLKSVEAVLDRLREAVAAQPGDATVVGWGLDPIYMENVRITRLDLDRAAADRPIVIMHASGHIMNMNSAALAMAGLMKDFFDRCYYPVLDRIQGRPYAVMVCAGSDGSNATRQIARIATGWRLKQVAEPLIVCTHAQTPEAIQAKKIISDADLQTCRSLGESLASGLTLGVF